MQIRGMVTALFLATLAVNSASQGAQGAQPVSLANEEEALDPHRATVAIDGEPLFAVRGVSAYPAERRARAIEDRIQALAANEAIAVPSLTLEEQPGATLILGNGRRLMAVYDDDAAVEGVSRGLLAQVYSARIADAIVAYRRARQPGVLRRHALFALGATIALLGFLYVARRMVRRLRAVVERRYRVLFHDLAIQEFRIVKAEHLWRVFSGFLTFASAVAALALFFLYAQYTLSLFPWTRGAADRLVAIATNPLRDMGWRIADALPDLVFLAVLFVTTRYVLKLVGLFFESVASGTVRLKNFDPEWALPTSRLARAAVIALALAVAYPYVPGSNTDAFKGVSLIIGVVVSLGSSSLIGNLIAGYSITYRRAFRLGDRVKIGEHTGEVVEMRLLGTHLRTPKNERVIVPNSMVVSSEVVNFSSMARDQGLILHTTVGVGYETAWRQVEAMLIEAAHRTPGLLQDHPPFVLQTELATFCVTYEINVYCDTPERMRILYTELHRNILDVFNEYGVQIMTPAYEGDPRQPKVVPRDQWYAAPARPPSATARPLLVPPSSKPA